MRPGTRSKALISAWMDFLPPTQREVAQVLRALVREAEPELTETVRWGQLVFLWGGSPLLAIAPHKAHVNLQVHNAELLPPHLLPDEAARQRGPRGLRFRLREPVDAERVRQVVSTSAQRAREFGIGRWSATGLAGAAEHEAPGPTGPPEAPDPPGPPDPPDPAADAAEQDPPDPWGR